MHRRSLAVAAAACSLALALPLTARASTPPEPVACPTGVLCAGVGIADATWHVGAGSGQHAGTNDGSALTGGDADPHAHATKAENSYGVASRLTMRALVVQGSNGRRIVLLKSDNYLAQNLLLRRVGQLLADAGSSITADDILHSASHNHSSPYYSTAAVGVWAFQDAVDLRAFEYQARQMRDAILEGERNLRAAKMGATTVQHDAFKGNVTGTDLADDDTPGGYPLDYGDNAITVLRFDDDRSGEPLAVWVNHGQHPESLDSYQLITADYLGPLERMVEDDLGAPMVFSQGDVGSAEGPSEGEDPTPLPDGTTRAWYHTGYAQAERGARLLADSVVEGWNAIGTGNVAVPLSSDVPVDMLTYWAPGPISHPLPTVGNCRAERSFEGEPGAPGAPNCERGGAKGANPIEWENLKAHGIPLPEHYSSDGYLTVEENARLQLQAVRLGEVLLGSCGCEAQVDLILNFESRADTAEGVYDGFAWDEHCDPQADGTWACPHPDRDDMSDRSLIVDDARFQRMKAQIHNDADGWDAPEYAPYAESEPADPKLIKGNFTKEELSPELGYPIVVGLGHTGDYNGYTVSYREYMRGDHYRKALTSYGPHTADYMVTRLVRMGAALRTGTEFTPTDPLTPVAVADEARQEALAQAVGRAAGAAYDAWLLALPDDAGTPEALRQPSDITRFDAASFQWRGGSNAVDNPTVRVERLVDGEWQPYADQSGQVQTMVDLPDGVAGIADTHAGRQEWHWTASFEAFDGKPARFGQTPDGTYRFVVDGAFRTGRETTTYHLESDPFAVSPWRGITISDLRLDARDVSFVVDAIRYPRTYASPLRFIRDSGNPNRICRTCTFLPWATEGEIASIDVRILNRSGHLLRTVPATFVDGRWVADANVTPGQVARIEPGDVRDTWGEMNGATYVIGGDGSVSVTTETVTPAAPAEDVVRFVPVSSSSALPPPPAIVAGVLALAVLAAITRKVYR